MLDEDTAREALRRMLDSHGIEACIGKMTPESGGFVVEIDCDGVPEMGVFERTQTRTQERDGRQWNAVIGTIRGDRFVIRYQGEFGTYGPLVECADEAHLRIWIGRGRDIPEGVDAAFRRAYGRDVAQACIVNLSVAAALLADLDDGDLSAANGTWALPAIGEQLDRIGRKTA